LPANGNFDFPIAAAKLPGPNVGSLLMGGLYQGKCQRKQHYGSVALSQKRKFTEIRLNRRFSLIADIAEAD
jgi:hypothetical protein